MKTSSRPHEAAAEYDVERNTASITGVLHLVALVAVVALLWHSPAIEQTRLLLWTATQGGLALIAFTSWWFVRRGMVEWFVRLALLDSAGTALSFGALAWLGPDIAAGTPTTHVLLIVLVAVTSASAATSSILTRRVSFLMPLMAVMVLSYSIAFLRQGEWMFAALAALWCAAITTLTRVGHRGMIEQVALRLASERDARHDDLTGLLSRTAFFEKVDEIAAQTDTVATHALLLCDLDGFKAVNDSYGHAIGDAVLTAITKRLDLFLPANATLGRMGGDEFAAVFPVERDAVQPVIERLLDAVGKPLRVHDCELFIAASAGWTWIEPGTASPELMIQADAAMYQSKNSETLRSSGFTSRLRQELDRSLELRQRFRAALKREEIEFWLQPLVRTADRMPVAVELLARWPQGGAPAISPDEFTRVADETGLAVELDCHALRTAVRILAAWEGDPLLAGVTVKTNVSATHLHNGALLRTVHEIVPWALRAKLGLEFTESRVIPAAARNHWQLKDLIAMGIIVSIDDFGVGYSSLSYLRDLPMSEIKIDRSFVANLDSDPISQGFVRAVVDIAQTLKLPTVAEGIETEQQFRAATELGVTTAQGFLLGQAVPISYTPTLLRSLERTCRRLAQAGSSTVRNGENAGISQD